MNQLLPISINWMPTRLRIMLLGCLVMLTILAPVAAQAAFKPTNPACWPSQGKDSKAILSFPLFENPDCQRYTVVVDLLKEIANTAIEFVLAIALIFLVITGYQFITSVGDKTGMENAKRSLLYIVIGVLAVLGGFMLVTFISNQFLDLSKFR